jgi:hypothetical protein
MMATYTSGGRRKATANSVTAAKNSAEKRRCRACNRKSAMQFHSDDFGFGSTCRWCGHSTYREREVESDG